MLRKISDVIEKIETFIITILVICMIAFSFLQVVLRNFFSISVFWFDDFSRHAVLWVGFLGASVVTAHAKHINIDILSRMIRGKAKNFINAIKYLISAIICIILTYAATKFIIFEMQGGEKSITLKVPVWYLEIFFPITLALMAFRFIILSIEEITGRRKTKEEEIPTI